VGIHARIRVFDMRPADAERPEAGDVLGRLFIAGHLGPSLAAGGGPGIGWHRLSAGQEWERIGRSYARAMGTRGVRSSSDFSGAGGYDGDEGTDPAYIGQCERAERNYQESLIALRAADTFAVKVLGLIQSGVLIEPGGVMFPPILKGLDALAALYRVAEWQSKSNTDKAA
jgi:hypothetical protein